MYVKGKILGKRQCGTFQNFVYPVTRYKKGWELAPYHFCLLLTHTNKHAKAFYNRNLNTKIHISMSRTDAWYKTEEIAPGVAGSDPLESVNRYYLYYMKAESPIQFSVNEETWIDRGFALET